MTVEEAGRESPPARIPVRLESLSDLVFGLALSIGSLFLVDRAPQSGADIADSVLLFGFGFFIIVMTWLGYSRTMAVLPAQVPFVTAANLLLLFVVAIEPYLFYVLQSVQTAGLADAASAAYGLDVGGMFLLQAALAYMVVREAREGLYGQKPLHPRVLARFKRGMRMEVVIGTIFVASALPIFWVNTSLTYVRFLLWFASLAIFMVGRARPPKG